MPRRIRQFTSQDADDHVDCERGPQGEVHAGDRFPTLGHSGRVGFPRHQPDVESDQLFGHRGSVRRRRRVSGLEGIVAGYRQPIPRGIQSNQHGEQFLDHRHLWSNRILTREGQRTRSRPIDAEGK